MYEKFKWLQAAADKFGAGKNGYFYDDDKIMGTCAEIEGVTPEGKKFTLKYSEESADE